MVLVRVAVCGRGCRAAGAEGALAQVGGGGEAWGKAGDLSLAAQGDCLGDGRTREPLEGADPRLGVHVGFALGDAFGDALHCRGERRGLVGRPGEA